MKLASVFLLLAPILSFIQGCEFDTIDTNKPPSGDNCVYTVDLPMDRYYCGGPKRGYATTNDGGTDK